MALGGKELNFKAQWLRPGYRAIEQGNGTNYRNIDYLRNWFDLARDEIDGRKELEFSQEFH